MSKGKQTDPGRLRHSITNRLNRKLFFRLVGLFMSINMLICLIAGTGLLLYCERKLVRTIVMIDAHGPPDASTWLEFADMNIRPRPQADAPSESPAAWPLPWLKPHEYVEDILGRGFRAQLSTFESTLRSIEYIVSIKRTDSDYEVAMNVGSFILYFMLCFGVLLAFELITLLSRTFKDRKMVRRTLDPIAELARAAQSLNNVNKQLDHEKMMALAGKLDGIDAGRLDTRIQVDDLQEELKNVAVAINGMLDRINDSYAAQARFVSDASHELRTPIAVIQGYANLLDRWGKEDEKALTESVAAIKDEAGNMKDLVEQLLFLARGDSNRITLSEELINLSELIDEVALEARMLDDGREFIVSNEKAFVMADRALIKQTLRILIDNAIKYTDPGGEITISVGKDENSARISVADTGIGIRPEVLPRVFDRFVRADESRTRATGGAGLGLSIAQWIAARHNGHLEILSREGIGTRISLIIPIAADLPPQLADDDVLLGCAVQPSVRV